MQTIHVQRDYTIQIPDLGTHVDIDELRELVTRSGSHFFDRDTLRYFKSRIDCYTFTAPDGWYFVTSEKHEIAFSRICEPRLYTVRCLRIVTKEDGTNDLALVELERFQAFTSLDSARRAAQNASKQARPLCSLCHSRLSIDAERVTCQECDDYAARHAEKQA